MKPILFNTEMVKAILDGRKTVTRRLVKQKYSNTEIKMKTDKYGTRLIEIQKDIEGETFGTNEDGTTWRKLLPYIEPKPQYQVGDILYVRETWAKIQDFVNYADYEIDNELKYLFRCDDNGKEHTFVDVGVKRWRPSIHMPKEVARLFLKVTDVRVEQLQNFSWEDAVMEGIKCAECDDSWLDKFIELWNSTIPKKNPADMYTYGWKANPWVWVIEFERCEKPGQLVS